MNPINNFSIAQATHREYETDYSRSFAQAVAKNDEKKNGRIGMRMVNALSALADSASVLAHSAVGLTLSRN